MCYRIVGCFAGRVTLEQINTVAREHLALRRTRTTDPGVLTFVAADVNDPVLHPDETTFRSPLSCDCDTLLGLGTRAGAILSQVRRARYQAAAVRNSPGPTLAAWVTFIRTLFDTTRITRFALATAWQTDDTLPRLRARTSHPLTDLSEDLLRDLPRDTLLTVHR